jgi:hypothetical protein
MQAQEHAYARWSIAQRTEPVPHGPQVDRAFDQGAFLRTHVLRPTWHYVARNDLRWLIALSGPVVNRRNTRRYDELGLDARTRARANDVIAAAVTEHPRTRRELGEILNRRRISSDGQRIAYLVMHAELTAVICSGPTRGTQHTYAAFDARVPATNGPDGDDALAELARRYFTTRGPATLKDFVWWSGLSVPVARRALDAASAELTSRAVDDRVHWFSEALDDSGSNPRVDLVQCYDEVIISYQESRDVLRTAAVSFPVPRNLDGYVHVVLLDGRLCGHWRIRAVGDERTIETRIGEQLGAHQRAALSDAIERYRRFASPDDVVV